MSRLFGQEYSKPVLSGKGERYRFFRKPLPKAARRRAAAYGAVGHTVQLDFRPQGVGNGACLTAKFRQDA